MNPRQGWSTWTALIMNRQSASHGQHKLESRIRRGRDVSRMPSRLDNAAWRLRDSSRQ